MFNHRAIMQDAWTRYRKARALSAANGFPVLPHRTLIANCLRTAWQVAKALARAARLAAVIAEPLSPPNRPNCSGLRTRPAGGPPTTSAPASFAALPEGSNSNARDH